MNHDGLLEASDTVLVVIDMQDGFLKAIHERERVVANCVKLIEAAKVFSIPILVPLQSPEKLGGCTQAIEDELPQTTRFAKTCFSCMRAAGFAEALSATGRRQVLLCGIEAHICVNQTAHEMLAAGYSVHVAKDAVSSRTPENWETGIEKVRDAGCVITSTETAIFELLRDAATDVFKRILPLVR